MTEQTIFNADQANVAPVVENAAPATSVAPAPTSFSIPTEASGLIGEGKKYRNVEDALKALSHSQNHIKTIEDENKTYREELIKRKSAEELLNEIKHANAPVSQATPAGIEADPEVLSQIVEKVLEKKTAQQTAQKNAKSVVDKFTAVYGEKAEAMYVQIAQQSGLTPQALDQLAMTSPSAVLKLAGMDSKPNQSGGKIQSDVSAPSNTSKQEFNTVLPKYATTKDTMHAFAEARRKVLSQHNT